MLTVMPKINSTNSNGTSFTGTQSLVRTVIDNDLISNVGVYRKTLEKTNLSPEVIEKRVAEYAESLRRLLTHSRPEEANSRLVAANGILA